MNLYIFGRTVTGFLARLLFNVRFMGMENIPSSSKGYILASNHRTGMDPIFIAQKISRQLRFMGKSELFHPKPIGWLMKSLGVIPYERGKGDFSPMAQVSNIIEHGDVFAIFPEGTRSKDGTPQRARSGIGMIAAQTNADVLPVAVCYGDKLSFRTKVIVRYGRLITKEELGLSSDSGAGVRAASKRIMADIVDLLNVGVSKET